MRVVRRILIAVSVLPLLAAACGHETSPAPTATPVTPTIPPVITKIVTPSPTETPLPTPTLPYNVEPAVGRWIVFLEIKVSAGDIIERVEYGGSLDLQVMLDGQVTGTGYFSPQPAQTGCTVRVLDTAAIGFSATGTTFPENDEVGIAIKLIPDSATAPERYQLTCVDAAAPYESDQPVLWPALAALQPRDLNGASVEGLDWQILLRPGATYYFSADLAEESGGTVDGFLSAEVSISRG